MNNALYWLLAKIISFLFTLLGGPAKLDVAFISNCRDKMDRNRIGNPRDFISWTIYFWRGLKGRLYMISSTTEEIGGVAASPGSIKTACDRFEKAVDRSVKSGARVILYAAGTKRLPIWDRLRQKYPHVIFTLGDNFTGVLLGANIRQALELSKAKRPRVLVIAPYGLLGTAAYLSLVSCQQEGIDCEVIIMGNPNIVERHEVLQEIAKKNDFSIAGNFDVVGKVDVVVTCNCAPWAQLTTERIDGLRKTGRKLIVVDPCEPANLRHSVWVQVSDRVIRLDSGNGYSSELRYILGPIAWKINRMACGLVWGCFCETFILAAHLKEHPEWMQNDWRDVTSERLIEMSKYLDLDFELPAPTNFSKPIPSELLKVEIVEPAPYELDLDV